MVSFARISVFRALGCTMFITDRPLCLMLPYASDNLGIVTGRTAPSYPADATIVKYLHTVLTQSVTRVV